MPSPFPGMDPFIEMDDWSNFHLDMIVSIQFQLAPQVLPKYSVMAERRVYLETMDGDSVHVVPDISLIARQPGILGTTTLAAETASAPELATEVSDEEHQEPYLLIRDRERNRVVTVIEFLSPTNKRRGLDGWHEYRNKRREYLAKDVHLIEIDLLRGGERRALSPPLSADYCVLVHRTDLRPKLQIYKATLRQTLPTIAVPLSAGDADATLNLQEVFTQVYDRVGYRYHLNYRRELQPPVRPDDEPWLREILNAQNLPGS